jgi:hypothetical protein
MKRLLSQPEDTSISFLSHSICGTLQTSMQESTRLLILLYLCADVVSYELVVTMKADSIGFMLVFSPLIFTNQQSHKTSLDILLTNIFSFR